VWLIQCLFKTIKPGRWECRNGRRFQLVDAGMGGFEAAGLEVWGIFRFVRHN
jgi:hypothetical protein